MSTQVNDESGSSIETICAAGENHSSSEEAPPPAASLQISQSDEQYIPLFSRRPIPASTEQPTRFLSTSGTYGYGFDQNGIGGWVQSAGPVINPPMMPGGLPTISWACSCEDCVLSVRKFVAALNNCNGMYGACVSSSGPIYSKILPSGIHVPSPTTGKLIPITSSELLVGSEGNRDFTTDMTTDTTSTSISTSSAATTTAVLTEENADSDMTEDAVTAAATINSYLAAAMSYYSMPMAPSGYIGQGIYSGGTMYYNHNYWAPPMHPMDYHNMSAYYAYGTSNVYPCDSGEGEYKSYEDVVDIFENAGDGSDIFETLVATPKKIETTGDVSNGLETAEESVEEVNGADGSAEDIDTAAEDSEKLNAAKVSEGEMDAVEESIKGVNTAVDRTGEIGTIEGANTTNGEADVTDKIVCSENTYTSGSSAEEIETTEKIIEETYIAEGSFEEVDAASADGEEFQTAEGSTEEFQAPEYIFEKFEDSEDNIANFEASQSNTEKAKGKEINSENVGCYRNKTEKIFIMECSYGEAETDMSSSNNAEITACSAEEEETREENAQKVEPIENNAQVRTNLEASARKTEKEEVCAQKVEEIEGCVQNQEKTEDSAHNLKNDFPKEEGSAGIVQSVEGGDNNKEIHPCEEDVQGAKNTEKQLNNASMIENGLDDEFDIIANGVVEINIIENILSDVKIAENGLGIVKVLENGLDDVKVVTNGVGVFESRDEEVNENATETKVSGIYDNGDKNCRDISTVKGYKTVRIVESVKMRMEEVDTNGRDEEGNTKAGDSNTCVLE